VGRPDKQGVKCDEDANPCYIPFLDMKKRHFIKLSAAAMAGAALQPMISCSPSSQTESSPLKNWAGNLEYKTRNVLEPTSVEDVVEAVNNTGKLRVLGTRHCFNTIADSNSALLSTARLNRIINIDAENWSVTVEGGIRYGEFCRQLHEAGFAIHNLASLPHISVAGACATATHGSGVSNGNLATNVSAMELVNGTGEIININRDLPALPASVVSLGCLGVVTQVTMDLIPTFDVRQDVYLNLPVQELEKNFVEIMSAGYSVSLFTDWQSDSINQVWIKSVVKPGLELSSALGDDFFGAKRADRDVHPIIEISAENCTPQMGVPGPWFERLPHFKMGFTPSSGEELQAEYFVPMESAVEAIKAVATLRNDIGPFIQITEIRSIAADNLWMSPCYKRSSIAIHFTLKQDIEGVRGLLPKIEEKLATFDVRPHWGKLFTIDPAVLSQRYPQMQSFSELAQQHDPKGKFRNEFVNTNIFAEG
jgi:alditol oxidase